MAGKGSKPRPYSVTQKQFANNWNNIFKNKSHYACGICDTESENNSNKNTPGSKKNAS